MESPYSEVFQSRLENNLLELRVPAHCLRLGMMPRKITNTLLAVSAETHSKEKKNIFCKKKGKYCVNGTMVTLKRRIQFATFLFYLSGTLSLLKYTVSSIVTP